MEQLHWTVRQLTHLQQPGNKKCCGESQDTTRSRQLDLTNAQKELYRTIETMWLDASSAQQQFVAADAKLKSSQSSYELVNEQFKLGMKNTVELLTEKNNLMSAQQERVQAKYMAILNRVLLEFYAGNQIEI